MCFIRLKNFSSTWSKFKKICKRPYNCRCMVCESPCRRERLLDDTCCHYCHWDHQSVTTVTETFKKSLPSLNHPHSHYGVSGVFNNISNKQEFFVSTLERVATEWMRVLLICIKALFDCTSSEPIKAAWWSPCRIFFFFQEFSKLFTWKKLI